MGDVAGVTDGRLRELATWFEASAQRNRETAQESLAHHVLRAACGGAAQRDDEIAAALRALIAARELAAEMRADDAINDAEIERGRKEGNNNYVREIIGAKRDTRAWERKLAAIIGSKP